jgi:hypothetical protein
MEKLISESILKSAFFHAHIKSRLLQAAHSSICLILLVFIMFVAFTVIAACQFRSKFCRPAFRGVLIAASFVEFFCHRAFLLCLVMLVFEGRDKVMRDINLM